MYRQHSYFAIVIRQYITIRYVAANEQTKIRTTIVVTDRVDLFGTPKDIIIIGQNIIRTIKRKQTTAVRRRKQTVCHDNIV